MGTDPAQWEKRKYPRYICDLGVEVRVGDAKSGYWGTLSDICLGGGYVTTFSPLPVGTAVHLVVKSPTLEINITGKVVTFHPGVGMGVQFDGYVSPDGEAHLKALVETLAHAANHQPS
jgi:hypothetical protein